MEFKEDITKQARKFAKAMKAPLIFCSSSHSINIKKIFQLIISKEFNCRPRIAEVKKVCEPIVEYITVWRQRSKKAKKKAKKIEQEKKDDI